MELTPEERKKIYEEEKARLGASEKPKDIDLTPGEKRRIYEEEKARLEALNKPKKLELTPEERKRIYEEEKARLGASEKPKEIELSAEEKIRIYEEEKIRLGALKKAKRRAIVSEILAPQTLFLILLIGALIWGAVAQIRLSNCENSCSATKSSLTTTQADLSKVNAGLASTQANLTATQTDLTNTKAALVSADANVDYLQGQLTNLQNQLDQVKVSQGQLTNLQNQLNQANAELSLYHQTGITVYSGIQPPFTDMAGAPVLLVRNPAAHDPSWSELENFILADKTDSNYYTVPTYTCANYAEDVYNHAEGAGIKAIYVNIFFQGTTIGHALDAFVTTDRGLIYIDCGGLRQGEAGPSDSDTTVSVKPGTAYVPQLIVSQDGWYYSSMGIVATVQLYW